MMDLAVINGLVFIEGGFRKADVGIKDGKFALIAEPGCLPEAERTIDAGGKYVLPGGIDTHVHYRDPGHWERETFEVGTRAAAAGGCTTFFEHPISMPPQWNGVEYFAMVFTNSNSQFGISFASAWISV